MMKFIRVSILLTLLLFTAFYSKLQRLQSTAWIDPLQVAIYPINSDQTESTTHYINALSVSHFNAVERFFEQQWNKHSELDYQPVYLQLMPVVTDKPPAPPPRNSPLRTIFWSLHLRYWAYQNTTNTDANTVSVFIQYQQFDENKRLAHSLGLQKGLIGIVNAYAENRFQETNNIVIAHELLHTVGATDKYDLTTGQPIYPDGFAIAADNYEQHKAEIMAGKIPLTVTESEMPRSLRYCIIGDKTANEIGWLEMAQ